MRVLLVEDEPRLASVISDGLVEEGFGVDIEHDGVSGLWRATEVAYDAIILDIMLPELNGFEVCAKLRAAEVWTPILMLTAKLGEYDEAEALDTGADDFLRKPFSFVVLLARLRALARRGAPERPTTVCVGNLTLDPASHTVHRAGVPIELTSREYQILHILMRASGDPVAASRILETVWGFDDDPVSNVVQVYISYLRAKIDHPFGTSTLQTMRGVGYRVIAETESLPTAGSEER